MALSREQAQALTRTVHLLRPAWSEEGIYAALAKCQGLDAFEVALAAIRAAADKNAKTPGVIPTKGSHWNEPDAAPRTEPRLSRDERRKRTCATCGALDGCPGPKHEFIPLDHASHKRVPADAPTAAATVRAELARARATERPTEGWCDRCGCWNGHAHPDCEGATERPTPADPAACELPGRETSETTETGSAA